jgi:hypothetical protein
MTTTQKNIAMMLLVGTGVALCVAIFLLIITIRPA